MIIARSTIAALLGLSLIAPAIGRDVTREEKQQAACYDDVMRLCSQFVPDVEATKGCMLTKKSVVSPACAAFYPADDTGTRTKRR